MVLDPGYAISWHVRNKFSPPLAHRAAPKFAAPRHRQAPSPPASAAATLASPRARATTQRVVLAALMAQVKAAKHGDACLSGEQRFLLWALQKAEVAQEGVASLGDADRKAVESLFAEDGHWKPLARKSLSLWRTDCTAEGNAMRSEYRTLVGAANRRAKQRSLRARDDLASNLAATQMRAIVAQRTRSATRREELRSHLSTQAALDAHAILHNESTFPEAFELESDAALRKVARGHVLDRSELSALRAKSYERRLRAAHSGATAYVAKFKVEQGQLLTGKELSALRAAATGEPLPGVPPLDDERVKKKLHGWVAEGGERALAARLLTARMAKQAQPLSMDEIDSAGSTNAGQGGTRDESVSDGNDVGRSRSNELSIRTPPTQSHRPPPKPPSAAPSGQRRPAPAKERALRLAKARWVDVLTKEEVGSRARWAAAFVHEGAAAAAAME
jgi:hypothetical protein